jgi:hypothetical protein
MAKYQYSIAVLPTLTGVELPGGQKANKYSKNSSESGIKNPLRALFEEDFY